MSLNESVFLAGKVKRAMNSRRLARTLEESQIEKKRLKRMKTNYLSFFSWKISGNMPVVDVRLSDKRLFEIINHVQSIPFPESKNVASDEIESEVRREFVR